MGELRNRKGKLESIMKFWKRGDVNSALNMLNNIDDHTVIVDFLDGAFSSEDSTERLTRD